MGTNQTLTREMLLTFLKQVDDTFPTALSKKQGLEVFADKLLTYGTLCTVIGDEKTGGAQPGERTVLSMVAGYTDHVIENRAYISAVATLPSMYGRGYAKKLVQEFVGIARQKGLDAVHLYAVESNVPAMRMYRTLGFEPWKLENETRTDAEHLILWL